MKYVGSELEIFSHANTWKRYWASHVQPWVRGDVLEVGAGIGGSSRALAVSHATSWTALEPSSDLVPQLRQSLSQLSDSSAHQLSAHVVIGTIAQLDAQKLYDTILYIDVLEHIEHDDNEVQNAISHLRVGGHLVVLAPAHAWLFSEFDKAIGHYRRYTASTLRRLTSPSMQLVSLRYLDCVGLAASLANRLLIRTGHPSQSAILLWDRWMVPLSVRLDPFLRFTVGKSILAVWRKDLPPPVQSP